MNDPSAERLGTDQEGRADRDRERPGCLQHLRAQRIGDLPVASVGDFERGDGRAFRDPA
jgi:hypothetical protein